MRSVRCFAGALALLLGAPAAIAVGAFGGNASAVIHVALGLSFVLIALSVFDFALPLWISAPAFAAIGVLGAIFLLQALSDLTASAPLHHLAYDVLGQRLEKALGYAFVLWCAALLLLASHGAAKVLGAIVLALILLVEGYAAFTAHGGGAAPEALKLTYLALFVWLLLEGLRRPSR